MFAISASLLKTIHELQKLKSFEGCALGGGTNLAIRYGHRKSTDIDLFFPHIIGKEGYESIKKEISDLYGNSVFGTQYPCDIDDQFIFLRFFVICDGETIKVEVLQNMKMLTNFESVEGINMVSELDIALFKLMSAANRATEKDIYDLDFLTEKFSLHDLFEQLKEKQQSYSNASDRNIFDLDKEVSPLVEPLRLLKFDELNSTGTITRPHHSLNRVDILKGQKSWSLARSGWRKKVRTLFQKLNIEFPGPASSDVE